MWRKDVLGTFWNTQNVHDIQVRSEGNVKGMMNVYTQILMVGAVLGLR